MYIWKSNKLDYCVRAMNYLPLQKVQKEAISSNFQNKINITES